MSAAALATVERNGRHCLVLLCWPSPLSVTLKQCLNTGVVRPLVGNIKPTSGRKYNTSMTRKRGVMSLFKITRGAIYRKLFQTGMNVVDELEGKGALSSSYTSSANEDLRTGSNYY